jgi:hypothetical protein
MPRVARTSLAIALTGVVAAEAGLVTLLAGTWSGVRDAAVVRHLFPVLTHSAVVFLSPAVLLALGFVIGAALLPARPHTARSVLTQLCGVGVFVVLLSLSAHLWRRNRAPSCQRPGGPDQSCAQVRRISMGSLLWPVMARPSNARRSPGSPPPAVRSIRQRPTNARQIRQALPPVAALSAAAGA